MLRKLKLISAFCTSIRTTYATIDIVHKLIDVGILRKGLLRAIPQVVANLFFEDTKKAWERTCAYLIKTLLDQEVGIPLEPQLREQSLFVNIDIPMLLVTS